MWIVSEWGLTNRLGLFIEVLQMLAEHGAEDLDELRLRGRGQVEGVEARQQPRRQRRARAPRRARRPAQHHVLRRDTGTFNARVEQSDNISYDEIRYSI